MFCACAYSAVRGCGSDDRKDPLYKSTDSTVEQIKTEHAVAGSELDNVTGQLDSAETAVGRADLLIIASRERVNQNAASLADCQRLVSDCRKIIENSKRIYFEVEKTNRN